MNDLIAKLQRLVHAKAINISTKEAGRTRHRGTKILPLAKHQEPRIGDFCRSIVVAKDESKKQLIIHITFLLQGEKATYVNHLKYKGYIRDYDLVKINKNSRYSPTSATSSRSLSVRRQSHRSGTLCSGMNKTTTSSRSSARRSRKGTSGQEQQGTKSRSRRETGRSMRNTDTSRGLSSPSMSKISPTPDCRIVFARKSESANPSRWTSTVCWARWTRSRWTTRGQFLLQEKQWADKHFMEGLKFLKAEKPDIALEHLNMARSFDKHSSKIYIARGCALANMNNFTEGLRQIKEALRLSPNNKEALRYLDEIRKEIRDKDHREREPEDDRSRKVRVNNDFQPARRK